MSLPVTAEVEQTKRSIVYVDVDKLLASDWGHERAEFTGDDAEFVQHVLNVIGVGDLLDTEEEDENGIRVEGDADFERITVYGVGTVTR